MIHDVHVRTLEPASANAEVSTEIFRLGKGLLHRIGRIDWLQFDGAGSAESHFHTEAHEVWAIVQGKCDLELRDDRTNSPTHGDAQAIHVDQPMLVLIPLGLDARIVCRGAVGIIRLTSESMPLAPHPNG